MYFYLILILTIISTGLSMASESLADNKPEQSEYIFKIATLAPKTVGWGKNIRTILHPAIKKHTQGQFRFKWFWGGILGNDDDYIRMMQAGKIDGAAFSGQGVILACPEMSVLELPFMFNNYAEVDYIRTKMAETFDMIAELHGYKIIAWTDQDFDNLFSTRWELSSLEDFKKAKFLSWYGTMEEKLLIKLGGHPQCVAIDKILSSFKTGATDTAIGPSLWVVATQAYSMVKYVNPMNIRYSPSVCFVTLKRWETMTRKLKETLYKFREEPLKAFRQKCRLDSKRALKAMSDYGIKFTSLPPSELQSLKKTCREFWFEYAGTDYSKELLEELLMHLAEFRAKN